jgi:hypothetical protein
MQFFPQGVKVRPAFGMQKPHMVHRTFNFDAVTMHQRCQGLLVKAGACIPSCYQLNSYV